MGLFNVKIRIASQHPAPAAGSQDLEALVDTGATYTTIPASILEHLGVAKVGRLPVRLADGSLREKDYGGAWIQVEGRMVSVTILFGEEADLAILGATTLEQAALAVDPVGRRLVPIQAIQA